MGTANLNINLNPIANQLNKSLSTTNKSVESLNKSVDSLNRSIKKTADNQASKGFSTLAGTIFQASAAVGTLIAATDILGPRLLGGANSATILGKGLIFGQGAALKAQAGFAGLAVKARESNAVFKTFAPLFSSISNVLIRVSKGFFDLGNVLSKSNAGFTGLATGAVPKAASGLGGLADATRRYGKEVGDVAKQTELFQKGLIGSAVRITAVGVGLTALGNILKDSENGLISATGSLLEFTGLLLGPTSLALAKVVGIIGRYVEAAGTSLVKANQNAAASFQKAEQQTFIFERTLRAVEENYPGLISGTEGFNTLINDLNRSTGQLTGNLQSAAAELVLYATKAGLSEQQTKALLTQATDYAAVIKTDVLSATLDLISGLNGNSQALVKYGLQLNDTVTQQALLDKGINANVKTLGFQEKAQARLITLNKQYTLFQGLAAEATGTFAGTAKLAEQRVKELQVAYGEGANVIESFNIGQRVFLAVTESISPVIAKVTGFFGALFGRFLQGVGIIAQLVFGFTLVTTSIKALNTLLATDFFQKFFTARIPLVNKSLRNLAVQLGASSGNIKSLGDAMKVLGQITVTQTKKIIASLLGVEVATLSLRTAFVGASKRIVTAIRFINAAFLTNPVFLAITAIIGVILILVKAFKVIEKETGALSEIFGILKQAFTDILEATSFITDAFNALIKAAKKFARVFIGVVVNNITFAISGLLSLIQKLPNAIVSADTKAKFSKVQANLDGLRKRIQDANFDIGKLGDAGRKVAGDLEKGFKFKPELPEELKRLAEELKNVGKSQLQILRDQRNARLKLIQDQLAKRAVTEQQAAALRLKVQQDFAIRSAEIEKKRIDRLRSIAERAGGVQAITDKLALETQALREAREAQLLTESEFIFAKENLEIQSINRIVEARLAAQEQEVIGFRDFGLIKLNNEKKILKEQLNNANLTQAQREELNRRLAKNEAKTQQGRLALSKSFFGDLTELSRGSSKELFAIAKAGSLATAIVSGATAVNNALAVQPFPLGLALATVAAVKTGVEVKRIQAQKFQTGLTEVPAGFKNDTFPAFLESGERVISRPQNQDLSRFLANQEASNNGQSEEQTDKIVTALAALGDRLEAVERSTVVNIGNREVIREVRDGLRSGNTLETG